MATLSVYWKHQAFDADAGMVMSQNDHLPDPEAIQTAVRQGELTDDHPAVVAHQPVLVEYETERVYTPADLPPDTIVYVEGRPKSNGLIDAAVRSGYVIRSADEYKETDES